MLIFYVIAVIIFVLTSEFLFFIYWSKKIDKSQ